MGQEELEGVNMAHAHNVPAKTFLPKRSQQNVPENKVPQKKAPGKKVPDPKRS
jgi:hypothetical protein